MPVDATTVVTLIIPFDIQLVLSDPRGCQLEFGRNCLGEDYSTMGYILRPSENSPSQLF
jgi:hypothetical protein